MRPVILGILRWRTQVNIDQKGRGFRKATSLGIGIVTVLYSGDDRLRYCSPITATSSHTALIAESTPIGGNTGKHS